MRPSALELCKWILRSQECFRPPLGLRTCFSDPMGGSPCPMACQQLTLQTTFANRPSIPLEQPGGPWAGVSPFLACLPWPAPHFSACESALSQRQARLSSCPPPPNLNGQGRPLSVLRHFVPRLKSPLYMPLAPSQPVIQAGPCGSRGGGAPGCQLAGAPGSWASGKPGRQGSPCLCL